MRLDGGLIEQIEEARVTGSVSLGKNRRVSAADSPQLRIVSVGGRTIAGDPHQEVHVNLPPDGRTAKEVTVEASGFASEVVVQVIAVPQNASSSSSRVVKELTLDNRTGGPVQESVTLDFPAGQMSQLFVMTKESVR